MAYTAIYSADFIFEKTPLRLHSNVKEFGVKRKGVLVETQGRLVSNVSSFLVSGKIFRKKGAFSLRFALFFNEIWFLGIPNFK